jgi:nucleoside-diphosphate-sugar epimerase
MEAINIGGTRALARLAAGRIGRWVQVSSVSVYGAVRAGTITEDSPIEPDSLYGRTKSESEAAVLAEGAAGGYEVTIARPSKILGLGMPNDSLFRLFTMIERGWFCFIGEPHAVMNLIHVDTVASALVLCGTRRSAAGRTYNLSEQISIEELVAIVADELGIRRPTLRLPELPFRVLASVFGRLPGVPLTHRRLDAVTLHARFASERITRELSHNPVVSLEAGLRELARSWKLNR